MRLSWVKILCILVLLCAVLNILEAKKSKSSKKENKNKQKPDKVRQYKSGNVPSYTEPVEITEKTELDSDNVQQNWPEKHLTQATLSDDHSEDSDEDNDNNDKKKKRTTRKQYRTTPRPPLRTTTRKVLWTQNVTANLTATETGNWTSSTGEINVTIPLNSSRDYGSYHRQDTEGHMGNMGHTGRMMCATGQTKFDKVEKDITALWGYLQGITQPVHVHVHNKDGDMEVDRSPRGHSEKKYSKPRKEREEKDLIASTNSKKGRRASVQGTYRHLSQHHSRHIHNHNHSHHEHTKHNHTKHGHSHHEHTKHNHTKHGHSHHMHTKHNHSHHEHTEHNHTKHGHSHHHHTKHHHAKDSHSQHHHTKHHHTYHGHPDQHVTTQPSDVLDRLGLSKLGKGRETHIHIHIHVDDKGAKQNKGDEHHKEETHTSEQDDKPLYATCDLRNHDPKHNISGIISLRQKPGKQLEVRVQVQGFSVPLASDGQPSPDEDTWLSNSSAVYNETNSRIPVANQHGFHVHEYGDFSQGCISFGGHFNPEGVTHGHRNGGNIGHVGDWGNIDVDASGQASSNFEVKSAGLRGPNSIIGRGIVIHARADDLGEGHTEASKTTGDAGGRLACCTVVWTKPLL